MRHFSCCRLFWRVTVGIPALCFTQAGNSSRLFILTSAPPTPQEGVLVSLATSWHLPACLPSCFSAVILSSFIPEMLVYPNVPSGSLPYFPFPCCQASATPCLYTWALMSSWALPCLGLQAGLSSCLPHVFTFKSFWSYSSWTGRGAHCNLSPDLLLLNSRTKKPKPDHLWVPCILPCPQLPIQVVTRSCESVFQNLSCSLFSLAVLAA